jgi:pSer/pThr/pTyr-binding forkhead associated (FHA) protein
MDLRQGIQPRLEVVAAMNFAPGTVFEIGESATLGRTGNADVPIEDPFASAAHARIFPRGQFMYIEDMGSTNGTYLNGRVLRRPEQ